ncbi:alkaline phosphatase D family protein [Rubritalea tangerina]|uniref:Alkaline phosphatase D family protein n=1 Tax=Rubritalea tangerina TaxID=430798 RepID=A0ABW4Z9Z1_9BACT
MARLIIGHTTHSSTKIWVRGDRNFPHAFVTLTDPNKKNTQKVSLEERHFYTGVVEFSSLKPSTNYNVSVTFGEESTDTEIEQVTYGDCTGTLETFPSPTSNETVRFLLGSCNLHSLGILSNPDKAFQQILELSKTHKAQFMMHCGDQIYYDIPNYRKAPDIQEYRDKYIDAWGHSRRTRKFLTQLPQYMILDDHEITNDFSNDMDSARTGSTPKSFRDASLKVYREFQHIRNPQVYGNQALYYPFSVGKNQFFVLDTRSERYCSSGEMIGTEQLKDFLAWLKKHKDAMKFVVTSVPFVFHVKHGDDKWCGSQFAKQREAILQFILQHDITGITFLTGDMHCSGHAQLEVRQNNKAITLHEIMSSPINQIGKSSINDFTQDTGWSKSKDTPTLTYRSSFKRSEFFDGHSNVTLVTVDGRNISFDIHRTKRKKKALPRKKFSV